jgi:tetratricopeptide (TPR) repeat protein
MSKAAILTLAAALVVGLGSAEAADRKAGQGHARKANELAAAGKCKQAMPEFDAAYRALRDPALLFNRAECLRKLGKNQQALYDYRKFLEQMPAAPNRGTVEARIAALDPGSAPPARHAEQVPLREAAPPAPVAPAEPMLAHAGPVLMPVAAPRPSLQVAALHVPVAPPAPLAPPPAAMVVAEPQPAPQPVADHSWLWMSVAVAVVAAAAGGSLYVASRPRNP